MENQPLDILSELASSAAAQEQQQEQEPISDQAFQALLLASLNEPAASTNQQLHFITQHQHAQDLLSAPSALQTEPSSSLTQIEPFQPSQQQQQQQQSQDELDFDDPNLFSPFDPEHHHHHLQQDPVSLTDQIDLLFGSSQPSTSSARKVYSNSFSFQQQQQQQQSEQQQEQDLHQLDLYHHLPLNDHHELDNGLINNSNHKEFKLNELDSKIENSIELNQSYSNHIKATLDHPNTLHDKAQKISELANDTLQLLTDGCRSTKPKLVGGPTQRALQIDAINRIIEGSSAIVDIKLPKGPKKKNGRGRPKGSRNKPKNKTKKKNADKTTDKEEEDEEEEEAEEDTPKRHKPTTKPTQTRPKTGRTASECVKQLRILTQEKQEWSEQDDLLLKEGVSTYGQNWQAVANHCGRSSNECINQWSKTLRPDIKKGKWDPIKDEALKSAVTACGMVWKDVAPCLRGRTDTWCRERWCNILNPRIVVGNWTPEVNC
ncbi:hypothetical protein PSHT_01551 [Puccinia striiformis]|uniref:Uncharacterized protein n=1 Tax=Puccinia striiformis TaxID=27350 RepID=A0A2S4WKF9_9BASI|nr:hypothetical protein PSHT_01551 [Puccinia striiformis]